MRNCILVLLISMIFLVFGQGEGEAKVIYRTVQATGHGPNFEKATDRALLNAITQVRGAEMATRARSSMSSSSSSSGGNLKTNMQKTYQEEIEKRTKGIVKSYDILAQKEPGTGSRLYSVKLEVIVASYEQSAQLDRLRISVLPMRIDGGRDQAKATTIEPLIRRGLEGYLTQTRRFAVLDRNYLKEQNAELQFIDSENVPTEELARMGNRVGADFLITGTVERASAKVNRTVMRTTGQTIETPEILVRAAYRVIDVATTQVVFAGTSKVKRETGSLESASDALASMIGEKILNGVMPIFVLGVNGDQLTLGQGGETMPVGKVMSLIALGEEIQDPYTKESLGRAETVVGTLKVVQSTAKISVGKIIKTAYSLDQLMGSDFIVRPIKQPSFDQKKAAKQKKLEDEFDKEFEKDDDKEKW